MEMLMVMIMAMHYGNDNVVMHYGNDWVDYGIWSTMHSNQY